MAVPMTLSPRPDVLLVSQTVQAEAGIVYAARVSNPSSQIAGLNQDRLIAYLIRHKHWSPFEMASMTMEIITSRGIAPQILRHRSFAFQEFSQRYAAVDDSGVMIYAARRQDQKNRQHSIDDLPEDLVNEWNTRQLHNWRIAFEQYQWAIDNGIAKECARMVLPLGTKTKLYMAGTVRSWMHYLMVRTANDVQAEHRDIARKCFTVFQGVCPTIAQVLLSEGLICIPSQAGTSVVCV